MGIESKVRRSDYLDPELMRKRDILHFEGESKESIIYVGKKLLFALKKSDSKIHIHLYKIKNGVVDFMVYEYLKGFLFDYYYNKLKEEGLII